MYDTRETLQHILGRASYVIGALSIFTLLLKHGFDNDHQTTLHLGIYITLEFCFAFFILKFLIMLVYTFEKSMKFLAKHLLESIITASSILYLVYNIVFYFFPFLPDIHVSETFHSVWRGVALSIFIGLELGRIVARISSNFKVPPSLLFVLSFVALIFIGAFLLMLPNATTMEGSMSFKDALFTSISASCVTGLAVQDTATYFTMVGHTIIMILIQLGGLNIITFASILAMLARKRLSLQQQHIVQDSINSASLRETNSILSRIFLFTLVIELLGAIFVFFSWQIEFDSLLDRIFHSVFHAVSAFNNAGFSLFTNSAAENFLRDNWAFQLPIILLIILGGLGFGTLRDMFNPHFLKRLFIRKCINKHKMNLNSRISFNTSMLLIILGTVFIFMFEHNNAEFTDKAWYDRLLASLFQSVNTRSAGFNTVDLGLISNSTLLFMLFLMFIGASPVSTGGGIKTNTIAVLFVATFNTLIGRRHLHINKEFLPKKFIYKALAIFMFGVNFIFFSSLFLSYTDPDIPIQHLVFELVSAFCTVGLSTGITTDISTAGQIILMISMFIGRVGTLTLGYALSKKIQRVNVKYPEAVISLG